MTFNKFLDLLHTKYPEATACMHGKFAQTDHNNKVEIQFTPTSKGYLYYGSYIVILQKCGLNLVAKDYVENLESSLKRYKDAHGKESEFFPGEIEDFSDEIARLEKQIADLKANNIIV